MSSSSKKRRRAGSNLSDCCLNAAGDMLGQSDETMLCPSLMESLALKLSDPGCVGQCLLELARIFREQSALCLMQAERLDSMVAGGDNLPGTSRESLAAKWQRQNVVTLVGESSDLMFDSHQMLDDLESRLIPWKKTAETHVARLKGKRGGPTAYTIFVQEKFDIFAERLGSRKVSVVGSEVGKAWRNLTLSERRIYQQKVEALKKDRK